MTNSATTHSILVSVQPGFMSEESDPSLGVYAFSYSVLLENQGKQTVQLLSRHWAVYSGGELFAEVKGEGVVGMQPILEPGDQFEYTRWTVIKDPIGTMKGTYTFSYPDGTSFDVIIPQFALCHNESLQ